MRGTRCCHSTWQRLDPARRGFGPPALSRMLVTVLLVVAGAGSFLRAADASAPPAPAAAPETPGDLTTRVRELLAKSHPDVDVAAMLQYYSRTSPDIHAEVRNRLAGGREDAGAYLDRLADHYQRLERVRQRNPAEYERMMSLDLLESRARMLGRLIMQLNAALADGSTDDAVAARDAASRAKEELRGVLERAFDGTQQNQRIELNRLEAELRTMRQLLDERDAKRDLIVRQRFMELCGQEAPAPPPTPPTPTPTPPAPPPAPAVTPEPKAP